MLGACRYAPEVLRKCVLGRALSPAPGGVRGPDRGVGIARIPTYRDAWFGGVFRVEGVVIDPLTRRSATPFPRGRGAMAMT